MASPVCSTPRLLKEVAPPLDRSVMCSQVAVRHHLQDPAHRAPKETDGHTLRSAEVMSFACQVSGIPLDEDAILSPMLLPGTTLDIIQDEFEDIAGGVTQQHHSLTKSGVTSPHYNQDVVPDSPQCYSTRA